VFGSIGATIINDEMNCELMSPRMLTPPPRLGPRTVTGALPLSDEHTTPICVRASRRGPMGLDRNDASPVIVTGESNIDAIPVNKRIVVPEFSQSTTSCGTCGTSLCMRIRSQYRFTSAPIAAAAFSVDFVSWEFNALDIMHFFDDNADRKNALCVWLFDGGGVMTPLTDEPENFNI
jgi:hypothetical protein